MRGQENRSGHTIDPGDSDKNIQPLKIRNRDVIPAGKPCDKILSIVQNGRHLIINNYDIFVFCSDCKSGKLRGSNPDKPFLISERTYARTRSFSREFHGCGCRVMARKSSQARCPDGPPAGEASVGRALSLMRTAAKRARKVIRKMMRRR